MRLIRIVLALLVLGIGALWSLQGLGLVHGSFMTGQRQWLYIGIVTMLVGLIGLYWANRRRI
ncbi:hypothetical protein FJ987_03070 [Mesorhizobium sp. CU2]|uniref:hypothetical protein n=1 Tax=unclassified Mesorhizobium TaxID=325217 RepID=UPI0011266FDF|nr:MULTISPECIES: hypothetical protein [unclassified Mesorhizobium]TPN84120.1 hypothetical protein FJ988_10835 [Mesorhizobium sp. CU3]TPO21174.1 hypothetical protein FJ987_03070 [Mesorhizobium sp. CU2]